MSSSFRCTPQRSVIRAALSRIAVVCLAVAGTLVHTLAHSAQVTFQWDYPAGTAAGFYLYCGTSSGVYGPKVDVGSVTTYTLAGLSEGATYYCAVTAYDIARVESAYSAELPIAIPATPAAAPVTNFTMTPASGTAPLNVTFSNTTTGSVTSWLWNFGDNTTSTAQNPPAHSYSAPGSYTVKLTATGPGGSVTKTATTAINVVAAAPVANFTMTPASGTAPLNVTFSNTTTGSVTSWLWNFGDNTTSTAQNPPAHSYSAPGSYTVKLTATGPGGSVTKTATTAINVVAAAPVANFTMTPASGTAPLNVTFSNTTTGSVTSWLWNFGDNTTSTAQNPRPTPTARRAATR